MDAVLEFGLEATRWLQINYPQLEGFLQFLSDIGRFEFYLAVLPLIYWCISKPLGISLTFLLAIADAATNITKHWLRGPRPYWLEPELGLSSEPSYGLPSGHAMTSSVAYLFLAAWLRRRWVWLLCLLMVFFMGVSRVFLGVHFVHDVIAGFLLALLILLGYFLWKRYAHAKFRKRILGQRLLLAILLPLFFTILYVALLFAVGEPDTTVAWADIIPEIERSSLEVATTALATLLGLGVGFVLESSRVRFLTAGPVWKRGLRYLIGIAGVIVIWQGLGAVFPRDPLPLAIPLRALRYFLMGLFAAYYAPMLFVRLGLAQAEPEPEIDLTIS